MAIFFYGFTLWLGAYLLGRRSIHPSVQLTGWGLLAYALALAVQILALGAAVALRAILLAPALLWIGAALYLLPEEAAARPALIRLWAISAIPLAILTQLNAWFGGLILLALLLCAGLIAWLAWRDRRTGQHPGNTLALLATMALFVGLSLGLLILPLNWIRLEWGLGLLGIDLVLLGLLVTAWDAFDAGAALRAHLLGAFVAGLYYAGALALIGGLLGAGPSLLLALISFGILAQAFAGPIQAALDRLVLPQASSAERQALRQAAEALPLLPADTPTLPDVEQLTRWTRRAISNLGDLPRLSASPLIHLPVVQGSDPLERARALKALLSEQIQQLKPAGEAAFGASDEWRYYNAVYFPYVRGLKPYTRRPAGDDLDPPARQALEWFQAYVPERTLHNWQNAAARLIAGQLRRLSEEAQAA